MGLIGLIGIDGVNWVNWGLVGLIGVSVGSIKFLGERGLINGLVRFWGVLWFFRGLLGFEWWEVVGWVW